MTTKHALGALLALSLLAPALAAAKERGPQARATTTPVQAMRERVEDAKDSLLNRNASSTAKRVELQHSVVKRIAEHTAKVLAATADRLDKIIARLESRVAKAKAEGVDTSSSERSIAEAKAHLSEARTKLAAFSSITLSADKLSENMQALRLGAADVKEHLGEAKRALVAAIRDLKPGRTEERNATSTASTTPSN